MNRQTGGSNMKKKTTILSIFLAVFMALALNVGNVKAAATGQDIVNYAKQFQGTPLCLEWYNSIRI